MLLAALLAQLFVAMPALAVARILAARCCDVDCPELPSAATADRCCSIGTAPASDPAVRSGIPVTLASPMILEAIDAGPSLETVSFAPPPSRARAAPLFLTQRSLQL
ncbi:MAG: hypothetical protein ACREQJ_00805 [Candidatus Binatia bacterium]